MCCRYYIRNMDPAFAGILKQTEESPLFARFQKRYPAPLTREGEVRPRDLAPVLATDRQRKPALFPMIWGFTLRGRGSPLVNARVETASQKPSFREAWQRHRCVIPASWYFEWQQLPSEDGKGLKKVKYAVQPRDAELLFLCGLYRIEEGLPVFVVLTREPSPELAFLHDRMPLMLGREWIRAWIDPNTDPAALLPRALTDMRVEKAE